jgi:hypothetical protein
LILRALLQSCGAGKHKLILLRLQLSWPEQAALRTLSARTLALDLKIFEQEPSVLLSAFILFWATLSLAIVQLVLIELLALEGLRPWAVAEEGAELPLSFQSSFFVVLEEEHCS